MAETVNVSNLVHWFNWMTRSNVPISIALVCALNGAASGQSVIRPAFEAASVKVSVSQTNRGSMRGGPGTSDPGRISFTNVTLAGVIARAFDLKSFQLSAPDWASTRRYDIVATVSSGASKEECNQMLRALLAERFHLAFHHETRLIQGFDLVSVRGASKLKAASAPGAPPSPAPAERPKTDSDGYPELAGPGLAMMEGAKAGGVIVFLTAKSQPLSALVDLLSREFQLPISDKTGLQGNFDFKLAFAPRRPGALPPASLDEMGNSGPDAAPNLTTAIPQQLGLRLNSRRVPTDVLVIDRADPVPIEN